MATAAAAESAKKLELLLECPICLKTLTQPKVFHCLHFFCTPCIGDLKPKTVDAEQCYECPTCRQVTPVDKLRDMHFIHDLLEIMALAKKWQKTCDKCKDETATHRCIDCKEYFCQGCRKHHLEFSFLQYHTWEELSESDQPIIDKHIYCQSHKGEVVKLHCKDCHKLICLLCNGTEHKQHQAETIDEAIAYLLPLIKQRTENVNNQISAKEKAPNDVQTKVKLIHKQYDDIESEVDAKCESVIVKAREDCKKTKQELAKRKKQHMYDTEELEKKLEYQLKGQKNVVLLSETALASTQGTSLLQAMQSGILETLESNCKHDDVPNIHTNINVKFQTTTETKENMIGAITDDKVKPEYSRWIDQKLTDVINKCPTLQKTVETGNDCQRLTKIRNEIWYTEFSSTVTHVYSMDGQKLRDVTFQNISEIRSLLKVHSGLAVASDQGLFLAKMNGKVTLNLLKGEICDITQKRDSLYALDNTKGQIQILMFDHKTHSFYKYTEIKIAAYQRNIFNTIQVTDEFVYVALKSGNQVLQFTPDGTLVANYETMGATIDQICFPRLSGADSEGTLLITGEENHRIKTLTVDGKWGCLNIDDLFRPMGALIETEKLFVAQRNGQLRQYSFN